MDWAERMGNTAVSNEAIMKLGVSEDVVKQLDHSLYLFMKNFTEGHAKDVIQHGVANGIDDAWRKLYRDQLQLTEDKRNILMTEFMKLKEQANASGLRHIMVEVERITDNWERCANKSFDEEAKVGKLRGLIPAPCGTILPRQPAALRHTGNLSPW